MISIGRLVFRRFCHDNGFDGGLPPGSEEPRMLQSVLQNTFEQGVLAGFIYIAWAAVMPGSTMSVPLLAALLFAPGRILFFASYDRGAPWSGPGFALTFYPSVLMLVAVLITLTAGL